MFSSFLGILGTWVVLAGMCEAGNLERSDLSPLSIVYTLYPYYNSETLLGVLKAEQEHIRVIGNVETASGREAGSDDATRKGSGSEASEIPARQDSNDRRSSRNDSNGSISQRNQQLTEITYWPPVQRGAAPQLRLGRASDLLRQTDI